MTRSNSRWRWAWPLGLAIVLSSLLGAVPLKTAQAHTATGDSSANFYWRKWVDDVTVAWRFTASYPTGTFRNRIINAADEWNSWGQPLQWHQVTPDFSDFNAESCTTFQQQNGAHWKTVDGAGGDFGFVHACFTTIGGVTQLKSTNVVFDKDNGNWYTQSDPAVPAGKLDLWSGASLEWGHMSGSLFGVAPEGDGNGHFVETDNTVCGASERATMCPSVLTGDSQQRDLEGGPTDWHDTHTFQTAY